MVACVAACAACNDATLIQPPPSAIVASPEVAHKYEGMLIRQAPANRGKEDGWFYVKEGRRQWVLSSEWLERNGFSAKDVVEVSSEIFYSIPENSAVLR